MCVRCVDMVHRGENETLTIRLVVGGNAILAAGDAHVLVYASTDCDPVEIMLPPRARWQACVAADFPFDYDAVMAAIREAGFRPVVSSDAAVSSSSARANN